MTRQSYSPCQTSWTQQFNTTLVDISGSRTQLNTQQNEQDREFFCKNANQFSPKTPIICSSGFDMSHYPQQIEQINIFSHDKDQKLLSSQEYSLPLGRPESTGTAKFWEKVQPSIMILQQSRSVLAICKESTSEYLSPLDFCEHNEQFSFVYMLI